MIQVLTQPLDFGDTDDSEIVKPLSNSAAKYNEYKTWLCSDKNCTGGDCSRSKELFRTLEDSKETLGVFINDQATSEYWPPGSHPYNFDVPANCTLGLVILDVGRPIPVYSGKGDKNQKAEKTDLPIGISLAHELGHAEQYVNKKDWLLAVFKLRNDESLDENERIAAMQEYEKDNLERNEWPICREHNLPIREKYE
jgi:hypothetical protein